MEGWSYLICVCFPVATTTATANTQPYCFRSLGRVYSRGVYALSISYIGLYWALLLATIPSGRNESGLAQLDAAENGFVHWCRGVKGTCEFSIIVLVDRRRKCETKKLGGKDSGLSVSCSKKASYFFPSNPGFSRSKGCYSSSRSGVASYFHLSDYGLEIIATTSFLCVCVLVPGKKSCVKFGIFPIPCTTLVYLHTLLAHHPPPQLNSTPQSPTISSNSLSRGFFPNLSASGHIFPFFLFFLFTQFCLLYLSNLYLANRPVVSVGFNFTYA